MDWSCGSCGQSIQVCASISLPRADNPDVDRLSALACAQAQGWVRQEGPDLATMGQMHWKCKVCKSACLSVQWEERCRVDCAHKTMSTEEKEARQAKTYVADNRDQSHPQQCNCGNIIFTCPTRGAGTYECMRAQGWKRRKGQSWKCQLCSSEPGPKIKDWDMVQCQHHAYAPSVVCAQGMQDIARFAYTPDEVGIAFLGTSEAMRAARVALDAAAAAALAEAGAAEAVAAVALQSASCLPASASSNVADGWSDWHQPWNPIDAAPEDHANSQVQGSDGATVVVSQALDTVANPWATSTPAQLKSNDQPTCTCQCGCKKPMDHPGLGPVCVTGPWTYSQCELDAQRAKKLSQGNNPQQDQGDGGFMAVEVATLPRGLLCPSQGSPKVDKHDYWFARPCQEGKKMASSHSMEQRRGVCGGPLQNAGELEAIVGNALHTDFSSGVTSAVATATTICSVADHLGSSRVLITWQDSWKDYAGPSAVLVGVVESKMKTVCVIPRVSEPMMHQWMTETAVAAMGSGRCSKSSIDKLDVGVVLLRTRVFDPRPQVGDWDVCMVRSFDMATCSNGDVGFCLPQKRCPECLAGTVEPVNFMAPIPEGVGAGEWDFPRGTTKDCDGKAFDMLGAAAVRILAEQIGIDLGKLPYDLDG